MNKINSIKIIPAIKEIGNKKEIVKETVQETVQEAKAQASNLGRDLVIPTAKEHPQIKVNELLNEGYQPGALGILYKVDGKHDIYDAIQYKGKNIENITICQTKALKKKSVLTQKLGDKWISIAKGEKLQSNSLENTSERAAKKATELQFHGYSIVGQDEKTLTFMKNDVTVCISKTNGKEIA